jgi:ferrous iron transport protein A
MKTNFNFEDDDSRPCLADLEPGQRAIVEAVRAPGALGRRLQDLGFVPGTPVSLLRRAPLGDPGVFALRGMQICLRRSETRQIRVRLEAGGPS